MVAPDPDIGVVWALDVAVVDRPVSATGEPPDDLTTAYDDGHRIGQLSANRVDLTVPGDVRLTAAAITGFEVDPGHRGRGVLTGMIATALDDSFRRGQVLATLSSPVAHLHRRFGFGLSTDACTIEVDPRRAGPIHRPASGTVDVMSVEAAAALVPDVYERCARSRPGTISRSRAIWERRLGVGPGSFGTMHAHVAFHLDSTERADGYVQYDITTDADAATVGVIRDLWAETSEVERALWNHLVTIDGVDTWRAPRRSTDDPIRFSMADPRAYSAGRRFDEQWLRMLDVDIALAARSYNSSSRALTLRVHDPLLSHNTGTWRIDSYGSFRSHGDPDIELGIETLSAAYLGGTSFHELRDAGRITERRPDATSDADVLFAVRPKPFCGTDA